MLSRVADRLNLLHQGPRRLWIALGGWFPERVMVPDSDMSLGWHTAYANAIGRL